MTGIRSKTVIALGGNQSHGKASVTEALIGAIRELVSAGSTIRAVSRFYSTPCFPVGAGPDFVNAAVLTDTPDDPEALLRALHRIEATYGRERMQRWGTRTLDLDLICIDDSVLPDCGTVQRWIELAPEEQARDMPQHLILPHPRLQDRAFVLVPMADIVPDWRHPILGLTVAQMRDALPRADLEAVRPL